MPRHPDHLTHSTLRATAVTGLAVPRIVPGQSTPPRPAQEDAAITMSFAGQTFTAALDANPSARDLPSKLPLDLTIGDHSTNEKTAHLPSPLTNQESGPFAN